MCPLAAGTPSLSSCPWRVGADLFVCMLSQFSRVRLSVTPWTAACQSPLSMRFSRQEYWSGLPCPSPGGSSQPGDWTRVSCIAGRFFTIWATRKAWRIYRRVLYCYCNFSISLKLHQNKMNLCLRVGFQGTQSQIPSEPQFPQFLKRDQGLYPPRLVPGFRVAGIWDKPGTGINQSLYFPFLSINHTSWNVGLGRPLENSQHILQGPQRDALLSSILSVSTLTLLSVVCFQNPSWSAAVVSDFCRLKETPGGGAEIFPGEIKELI